MAQADKSAETPLDPKQTSVKKGASNPLQWFREAIAGIISLVILLLAAIMLYGTYNYAREDVTTNADSTMVANRKEAYERQKDIMLYALALLGTVTGYYLGRVPAELHAQQAQRSANNAQEQLQKTQTKLSDTAGSAAAAITQATIAEKEKDEAKAKLNKAAEGLNAVKSAISKRRAEPKKRAESTLTRKTLGELDDRISVEEIAANDDDEDLRRVEQEIDVILRDIHS